MIKKLLAGVMSVIVLASSCCAAGAKAPNKNTGTNKSSSAVSVCKKVVAAGVIAAAAGGAYYLSNKGDKNIVENHGKDAAENQELSEDMAINEDESIVEDYADGKFINCEKFIKKYGSKGLKVLKRLKGYLVKKGKELVKPKESSEFDTGDIVFFEFIGLYLPFALYEFFSVFGYVL